MWQIRELTADLIRSAAECHIASWQESYRGIVPDHVLDAFDIDERAAMWERRLADHPHATQVAVEDGAVIGFATASPHELHALYVRRYRHGSGVADELIGAAIGARPCSLWVFEANPRAQAFYRKHGFVPAGERKIEPFSGAMEIRMVRFNDDDKLEQ
ncbi:GNAT family N-acetyltransferase [Antrihabitans stalactiti]|uniref:GNAT family N-acetyltransferase n=1 Tax=Antrihabitans stalactiti TaxID=2584121 RepID=A0A848KAY9_9NOCA|nr:GNAT family N-acetyltransferase [Antrihabitans stalactiti]NMN94374.1 GNAT family N-acetyltransferase [Antrihabitans stalactiti]